MVEIHPSVEHWNSLIGELPDPHLLQTWEWGQEKKAYGWNPTPVTWSDAKGKITAAALILEKDVRIGGFSAGLRILYVPRGPILDWSDHELRNEVLADLQAIAKKRRAIFVKIDPEVQVGAGIPGKDQSEDNPTGLTIKNELEANGWVFSQDQIQFRNTAWLDLTGSEDDWLARMHQKTRYNLRLAQKKGVTVRRGVTNDLPALYKIYAETSVRDGFVIRDSYYYLNLWQHFIEMGMADPLIAEVDGQAVAGLILFHYRKRAWYLYGMSREIHREKMPNYLLQWEAMKYARDKSCSIYDLWGAPDIFDESDSLYGVFRFKDGLGAKVIRTIGAWDYPARPIMYQLYTNIVPRILDVMRRRGKKITQQQAGL